MPWYALTDDEADGLNPPDFVDDDVAFHDDWLPVGVIPRPGTRLGWFFYHLVHGLGMRYPLHKVLGYALANTKPAVMDADADYVPLHGAGVFTISSDGAFIPGRLVGYMVAREGDTVVIEFGESGEAD